MSLAEMLQTVGVTGALVQLSDYDAPLFMWSDTEQRWKLTAEWHCIQDSTQKQISSTNTAADTTAVILGQYSIPPGVVGPGSRIRARWLYSCGAGGSTSQKICYMRFVGIGGPSGNCAVGNLYRQSEVNIYCTSGSTQVVPNSDVGPGGISNANPLLTWSNDILANGFTMNVEAKFGAPVAGEFVVVHRVEVSITP